MADRGSNVNDENRDLDGGNLLHFAASRARNPQVLLKKLLERGADLESKNRHGGTPLAAALQRGKVKAVRFLLKWGADPSVFKPSINSRFNII
jgi:ankyrin repeat protein